MNLPTIVRPEFVRRAGPLARQLSDPGFACVTMDTALREEIERVDSLARTFFAQPVADKRRFAAPAFVEGYREIGQEYSKAPDRPDLTESFSMWYRNRDRNAVRAWCAACPLHAGITRCADRLSILTDDLLQAMAAAWSPGSHRLRFRSASYIQINHYEPARHERELLQDAHEDGHLITLVRATAPGLEIKIGTRYVAANLAPDELLVMPGSLLTLMTGGLVPPLYHRVRNNRRAEPRRSLMFFVNPEIDQALDPWIRNASNAGIDILARAISAPKQFGLPTLVEGEAGLGGLSGGTAESR